MQLHKLPRHGAASILPQSLGLQPRSFHRPQSLYAAADSYSALQFRSMRSSQALENGRPLTTTTARERLPKPSPTYRRPAPQASKFNQQSPPNEQGRVRRDNTMEEMAHWQSYRKAYSRARIACWAVIALFGVVYAGREGFLSNQPRAGKGNSRPTQPQNSRWQIMTPRKNDGWLPKDGDVWSDELWTVRAGNFAPKTLQDGLPYLAHLFAHGSPMHLLFNSFGFLALGSMLMPAMGIASTLVLFGTTGTAASLVDAGVSKAYAERRWQDTFKLLKAGPDPNPSRTLRTSHLGASGGLCAMAAVAALQSPGAKWGLMFLPIMLPRGVFFAAAISWDAWGFYTNAEDGIGHGAHLAGYICGTVAWFGFLRWTRFGTLNRATIW